MQHHGFATYRSREHEGRNIEVLKVRKVLHLMLSIMTLTDKKVMEAKLRDAVTL